MFDHMDEKQLQAMHDDRMEQSIDWLNRQEFIDKMLFIAKFLSDQGRNVCYAINGGWGVGKSFVLDRFEEKAVKEIHSSKVYMVFRYDCWEYDYYEEPLIAIVASILDQIDKLAKIPEGIRNKAIETLKIIGEGLAQKAFDWFETTTGIKTEKIVDTLKEGCEAGSKAFVEAHSFDSHFGFKKVLTKLRETITNLANEQTLIFMVDELDRCLPEYTIKVLERLHHLFDEIPNVQLILAINKDQLEHTLKGLYGGEVDTDRYFAKFIDFEMELTRGEISGNFEKQHPAYSDCFENSFIDSQQVNAFYETLFKDLPIRDCKLIVEKSFLCHRLLSGAKDRKMDSAVVCVELFFTFLKYYDLRVMEAKKSFNLSELFDKENMFTCDSRVFTGLSVISGKYRENPEIGETYIYSGRKQTTVVYTKNLWGLILGCYRSILGFSDIWEYGEIKVQGIKEYAQEYWRLLKKVH